VFVVAPRSEHDPMMAAGARLVAETPRLTRAERTHLALLRRRLGMSARNARPNWTVLGALHHRFRPLNLAKLLTTNELSTELFNGEIKGWTPDQRDVLTHAELQRRASATSTFDVWKLP
jgi:hypothetical protein